MKSIILLAIISIGLFLNLNGQKADRLSLVQSFYPEYTQYIFNSEEEYIKHGFFQKDETITSSGKYSYKWENPESNNYINLEQFLPKADANGHRDFSIYDSLYINIYSKEKSSSTFIVALNCQYIESLSKNAYFYYYVKMNFKGWKEFKISLRDFIKSNDPDINKVTSLYFSSKGWGQIINPQTVVYIDKFFFTKAKYEFNMNENEIDDKSYSNIINRMIYTMTYNTLDQTITKTVINRVNSLIGEAKNYYEKMNKKGLPFESSMTQTSDMSRIYAYIRSIAIGYASEGGELYKDEKLLEDILVALDYMHENYYNRREEKIFSNDNWWDWEIGSAEYLLDALVCISGDISQKLIDKYLEPINRYVPFPSMTMSNRVNVAYVSIFSSVLQKDYKRISISVEMLRECFDTVEKSDGFYDDGSFIQHEYYSYLGEYGDEMMTALSIISYSLEHSIFRLDDFMIEYQYYWIINSFLPSMYNGGYMDLIRGRSISRNIKGDQSGKFILNTICLMIDYIKNEDNKNYLKSIIKNVYELNKSYLIYALTPASLIKLEEYENDENIQAMEIKDFAKVFSRIDKAISQVNGVGIGISMSSTRIGKYESINNENTKGWYTGDGMTYVYLNVNDYAFNYWPYINHYRLPGTTVTKAKREEKRFTGTETLTNYDFVGGTYANSNMVTAMQFESSSQSLGFTSTLIGNKAYFVFGEQLVCLGNSIYSQDDYEVETIIENRNLTGKLYMESDNPVIDKVGKVNSNYIYIENYGGIFIPEFLLEKARFNITDKNFLEIYFIHGKKFENENYEYMIFPKIKREEIPNAVINIEILSNNSTVSAVKNKKLNLIEYVFWKSGQLNNIKVDNPCTLIIDNDDIYVTDPTHKLDYVKVSIGNDDYMIRVEKGYTSKIKKK